MSSGLWIMIGIIATTAIITNGVVQIIKEAKSKGGSKASSHMEADLAALEQDVEDQRQRIEVLEKIVTDGKYDLGKQIDDLAN